MSNVYHLNELYQIATELRAVVPAVEQDLVENFGDGCAKGLSDLVHTDWLDSCHSDEGEATKDEWKKHKILQGGRVGLAWEQRRRLWHSMKVSSMHIAFAIL